ncbi:IQ and ubiquitin-like domain-containing protein isoform X1 [Astyanax mexicanus]|uniref:IQ and ubiquitin-like domain-containing protein isoform X1 n=1 Tax=Astyanax mexicanus TaxID=7994 RepID=UPI0020CB6913|nr:IQ and ubiquitin-like domain-containing protein isoform X1 [Astyanax mexicanus]
MEERDTASEPDHSTEAGNLYTAVPPQSSSQVQSSSQTQAEPEEPAEEQPDQQPEMKVVIRTLTPSLTSDQEIQLDPAPPDPSQDALIPQESEVIIQESDDVGNSTATVKILIMPEGHMMTMAFTIGLTAQDLKNHFASELRVPSDIIQIKLNGVAIENQQTLMSLGVQPHGTVQLEMSSLDPENYPIKPVKPQQECSMPDVITVRVQTDVNTFQDVVVEIERATQKKPFLGGYRHKISKTDYHHAAVQTVAKRRPDRGVEMFSKDTQTVVLKSQAQQCTINTSTQMTKIGLYVSNMKDKLLTPGTYITADQLHSTRLKAVITIQTYTRRWRAQRLTAQLRLDKELQLVRMEREERRKIEEKEEQIRDEYCRRMNPRKKEDFALLYSALEKWRQDEVERINATLSGAERKAALCVLLKEETQLIASIGSHRITAGERNQEKAVQVFLNKCAAPKTWRAFDGTMTQMDTPESIRAKELRDLYNSINLNYLSQEERLDVLLTLKHTVKEHDCKLTKQIVELIDREADLLLRGVKESNLEGLRKRIATLFLQYIKTPTFNPQVSRFLQVPQDPAQLKKNIYFCRGCSSYLLSTDFALTASARVVGLCLQCSELDNEARCQKDSSHYKTILKRLRETEAESSPDTKITYLLQEQDLQYLVDVVWGAQSALCAWNDLHDLVLVRWDRHWEWSPWNCILLTKDEAATHYKVENMEKAYGEAFIRNIRLKHAQARKYFSQIRAMAEYVHDGDSTPAAHSDLLVTKPITTLTK